MSRAEATLVYLDTLEELTSDGDILAHCVHARKVAHAALESRLTMALIALPDQAEPNDWEAYDHLAHTTADICDEYGLEPEDMVTVLDMCQAGLESK